MLGPHTNSQRTFRRRGSRRGYTAVELVMALGIFAVGVTGVFAMQRVTSGANAHAKNVAIATFAAESWLEQLAVDATLWTQTALLTSGNTTWLDQLGTNPTTGWFLPASSGTFGPGFDALGANVANTSAAFCTHIRLTRLMVEPNGLIRTEVRVFWPKPGPVWSTSVSYCPTTSTDVSAEGAATDFFHFVYKTSAVRQMGGL
jgi:hypothetical protein